MKKKEKRQGPLEELLNNKKNEERDLMAWAGVTC